MISSGARGAAVAVAAGAGLLLVSACGGEPAAGSGAPDAGITVLAAASLTESFTRIGRDFEAEDGHQVTFSFGSSATLATQVTSGAPADVFAAASPATMKTVTDAGLAGTPANFVSNTLEIAVPAGNPGKIVGLADFGDAAKKIAICAPQVPCGAAAVTVFVAAGITPRPDTYEQDVKGALQKVAGDEVDAALVYRTDVIAAGDKVAGIDFPEAAEAVNEYPIATLTASKNPAVAQAFVDYVQSAAGRAVLTEAGFAKP